MMSSYQQTEACIPLTGWFGGFFLSLLERPCGIGGVGRFVVDTLSFEAGSAVAFSRVEYLSPFLAFLSMSELRQY